MIHEQPPTTATEHEWLARGIQEGQLREETAVAIMKLLDGMNKTNDNDQPIPILL